MKCTPGRNTSCLKEAQLPQLPQSLPSAFCLQPDRESLSMHRVERIQQK